MHERCYCGLADPGVDNSYLGFSAKLTQFVAPPWNKYLVTIPHFNVAFERSCQSHRSEGHHLVQRYSKAAVIKQVPPGG